MVIYYIVASLCGNCKAARLFFCVDRSNALHGCKQFFADLQKAKFALVTGLLFKLLSVAVFIVLIFLLYHWIRSMLHK